MRDFKQEYFGTWAVDPEKCSTKFRGENCPEQPVVAIKLDEKFEYFCERCFKTRNKIRRDVSYVHKNISALIL